jgi:hypothetical protein
LDEPSRGTGARVPGRVSLGDPRGSRDGPGAAHEDDTGPVFIFGSFYFSESPIVGINVEHRLV